MTGKIRKSTRQPALAMVRQLALSVTATVAATMILGIARQEFAVSILHPARPEMTSGGKFAARIETGQRTKEPRPVVAVHAVVPLLVADEAPQVIALPQVKTGQPVFNEAAEVIRGPKHITHIEPRHHVPHDILPPQRAEITADGEASLAQTPAVAEASSLAQMGGEVAATVGDVSRHVALLGGLMLDPHTWSGLLP